VKLADKLKKVMGDELELVDIFDDISPGNVRRVVADNITYTLKREKLLPAGYTVLIPVGGDHTWEPEDPEHGQGHVQVDFEIFAPDMNTIVAYGTAYGYHMAGDLTNLTTEITQVTGEKERPRPRKRSAAPHKGKDTGGTGIRGIRR